MIYLAESSPDALISGDWLIKIIGTIIVSLGTAGAAWIVAMKRGEQKGAEKERALKLPDPMPEVPIRKVSTPPTFGQHMELVRRIEVVESNVTELRRDQAAQFVRLLEVGERRKDDILKRFDDVAAGFHARVNQIISEGRKGDHS